MGAQGRRAILASLLVVLLIFTLGAIPTRAVADAPAVAIIGTVMVGMDPSDVAIDPKTHIVFVTNGQSNTVSMIDEGSQHIAATVAVGRQPTSIAVDSGTHLVYVSDLESAAVSVLDGVQRRLVATIPVGHDPGAVAVDSVDHRVYVADQSTDPRCAGGGCNDVIRVLSGRTFQELATREQIASWPFQMVVDQSTRDLVFSSDYKYEGEAGLHLLDTALRPIGGAGPYYWAGGVAIDPGTRHIFVGELMAKLVVLAPQPGQALTFATTTVPVGVGIHHLALDPSTETLYVANASSHTVSVVDVRSNQVVQTVPIGPPSTVYFAPDGPGPGAIAVDPVTHLVYVADLGGNTVTVLQGMTKEVPGAATSPTMPDAGAGGGRWQRQT